MATWYPSDFPNSCSPLSLCSSHTDFAAARTCQACFHFREFDLAVLPLRMLFPLITIWLIPSSFFLQSPLQNEACSDHPIYTTTSLPVSSPLAPLHFLSLVQSMRHALKFYIIYLICLLFAFSPPLPRDVRLDLQRVMIKDFRMKPQSRRQDQEIRKSWWHHSLYSGASATLDFQLHEPRNSRFCLLLWVEVSVTWNQKIPFRLIYWFRTDSLGATR